jgi:NhaP-type Na+/H+ or K+/H+ antiporter
MHVAFAGVPWTESFLMGEALSPTETGLNDGLALPRLLVIIGSIIAHS